MVKEFTYLIPFLENLHKSISLNELEAFFKRPHQTIKAHLKHLVKARILLEEKRTRFRFYALNLKNPLLIEYLALCEKERMLVFLKDNILFFQLYKMIAPFLPNVSILLFGSVTVSKNFADIDLLILSQERDCIEALKLFEKTYSVKLHVLQTTESELSETLINEIKSKHIILSNHNYFIKILYKHELGLV
ncbi:hypothetical protein HYW21_00230 [Candidatus Woesearchaeota archaeon]|nr:hypothetical protein [Candidatus Woesearchaeota archaeon]